MRLWSRRVYPVLLPFQCRHTFHRRALEPFRRRLQLPNCEKAPFPSFCSCSSSRNGPVIPSLPAPAYLTQKGVFSSGVNTSYELHSILYVLPYSACCCNITTETAARSLAVRLSQGRLEGIRVATTRSTEKKRSTIFFTSPAAVASVEHGAQREIHGTDRKGPEKTNEAERAAKERTTGGLETGGTARGEVEKTGEAGTRVRERETADIRVRAGGSSRGAEKKILARAGDIRIAKAACSIIGGATRSLEGAILRGGNTTAFVGRALPKTLSILAERPAADQTLIRPFASQHMNSHTVKDRAAILGTSQLSRIKKREDAMRAQDEVTEEGGSGVFVPLQGRLYHASGYHCIRDSNSSDMNVAIDCAGGKSSDSGLCSNNVFHYTSTGTTAPLSSDGGNSRRSRSWSLSYDVESSSSSTSNSNTVLSPPPTPRSQTSSDRVSLLNAGWTPQISRFPTTSTSTSTTTTTTTTCSKPFTTYSPVSTASSAPSLPSISSFSPGLEGVIAGESAVSTVSAEGTGLCYRGYPIEELAAAASFEEVLFLLLHAKLPTHAELQQQQQAIVRGRILPPQLANALECIPAHAHPMDVLRCGCSLLGALEPERNPTTEPTQIGLRLISVYASILFYWHYFTKTGKRRISVETLPTDTIAAHFMKLLHYDDPDYQIDRMEVRALDLSFILYAEHEFNASTFAARVTAATGSDMYSAICSAIGTLRGHLHGGANEGALQFLSSLSSLKHAEDKLQEMWVSKEKIMGFGHRVYKKEGDPRAPLLMHVAEELSTRTYQSSTRRTQQQQLVAIAKRVQDLMLQHKDLHPNVDFPSALVYYECNIPESFFTPLFAIARTAGWTAHIIEQREKNRLIRPLSFYIGPPRRHFSPLQEREEEFQKRMKGDESAVPTGKQQQQEQEEEEEEEEKEEKEEEEVLPAREGETRAAAAVVERAEKEGRENEEKDELPPPSPPAAAAATLKTALEKDAHYDLHMNRIERGVVRLGEEGEGEGGGGGRGEAEAAAAVAVRKRMGTAEEGLELRENEKKKNCEKESVDILSEKKKQQQQKTENKEYTKKKKKDERNKKREGRRKGEGEVEKGEKEKEQGEEDGQGDNKQWHMNMISSKL